MLWNVCLYYLYIFLKFSLWCNQQKYLINKCEKGVLRHYVFQGLCIPPFPAANKNKEFKNAMIPLTDITRIPINLESKTESKKTPGYNSKSSFH